MPNTRGSDIRMKVIDRCLRSKLRYSIEDIMNACNEELEIQGYKPVKSPVTIHSDFAHIDAQYYTARKHGHAKNTDYTIIECEHVGRERFYHYWDRSFSIYKLDLSSEEMAGMAQAVSILKRFEGMPQFTWVNDMLDRFSASTDIKGNPSEVVGFDDNPDLKGKDHFTTLFNAIYQEQPLLLIYHNFKDDIDETSIIHPWYLKQFNRRWFCFAWNETKGRFANIAFDRIVSLQSYHTKFIRNDKVNFDEYFKDMIGVTRNLDSVPQTVRLWISPSTWPYIRTKPFNNPQSIIEESEDGVIIEFDMILNYEFEQNILYQGENIKVLAPESLKQKLSARIKKMFENYK